MLASLLAAAALSAAVVPEARLIPEGPRFASLQGGETLGAGGTELLLTAGFSTLSGTYAQGLNEANDLGAQVELDWLTGELFAGGLYRQLTWRFGETFVSWRARAGLYVDGGATWAVSSNHSATGIQAVPGLALSRRFARVTLSAALDGRIDLTLSNQGGRAVGVKGTVACETPLWGDLLAGARVGVGGLWSYAGAPFAGDSPRTLLDLSALLTYRLF
ncbi:hypothetical protein [Anaeromyxobacter diazotrophicus]|uniref:Cellulose biosynthesis protein BcsS n=1 Tax=Anaeromyxobacter diazotrophicus TaxID=2590199 RepID=A0A7I9VH23_9BACT|nr:hypothetical protein [Anaeromyxobacter diazotrophicus]GEJ55693.1 hypothetical protein AMYX_04340 [Anaeromyxobacter diazotrophicus]